MVRLLRLAILMACILFAGRAFAAGGACPSGANYTNPTNPIGAPVPLASLGITNCYYIAANGSDSNSGTSETSPWLHSPGMQQCSSKCASVTLSAGIGVIFRGGDTWHFGNSSASPYGGVVTTCANNGKNAAGLCLDDINATSSNPIYYGVDKTWFTGGSWTRPILTADNPLCGLGNTPAGCTYNSSSLCLPGAGSACTGIYYVSSCLYQVGNSNNLVDVGFSKYIYMDNFDLTGLCQSHTGQPGSFDTFLQYASAQAPLTLANLYIHGASHLKFAAPNGQPACNGSTVCININAFYGGVTNGSIGETLVFNVVDFSDSDPVGENLTQGGFYNVAYNYFGYTTQGLMPFLHVFHDNLYEFINGNGHANGIESKETSAINAIYNNVFRHVQLPQYGDGGVFLWFGPQTGVTDYIFNNLAYDVGPAEYINNGGVGLTTNNGNYTYFNNTFQSNTSQPLLTCGSPIGTLLDVNNHWINNQAYNSCNAAVSTTPKTMTNATAASDGYTSSQTYAYSPTSGSSPTVSQGTNVQSSYCSALSTAAGSDPTLSDAASACANDTRYACIFNSTAHAISCPARTVVARLTSWDIGAYESGGAQANAPNPPSNLIAVIQ